MLSNYIGLIGIVALIGVAVLLSSNRKAINLRIVGAALGLQITVAFFVIYSEPGKVIIEQASFGILKVMAYSRTGIEFIFGGLATEPSVWSFAVSVLPVIIFFSALVSVLYHLGIMQIVVNVVGGALRWVMGTHSVESLNAAANIFLGQTEAPLVVRPYLSSLTEAQLFAVMVSGLASIAGTMLVAYVQMGADLKFLLAASIMAAPGGLLMAKIVMPDQAVELESENSVNSNLSKSEHENVILAAAVGAADGLKLAVNIGAMLIAFIALIALVNGILGGLAGLVGMEGLSLENILGWLFAPVMYLIGIPWSEAIGAGSLFGEKLVLNEFVAFSHLNDYLAGADDRTRAIATISLCSFANLGSIAVLLGGIGNLIPEKKNLIAKFGLKAVATASLSNLMSAALAGIMLNFGS